MRTSSSMHTYHQMKTLLQIAPALSLLLFNGMVNAQSPSTPVVEKKFTKSDLQSWSVGDSTSTFSTSIVPGEPGQMALQVQYTVTNEGGVDGQETPASVTMQNDSICKLPALAKEKPYVCEIRVKASQPRSMRLFLLDQEGEHFFTAQQLVSTQWQTLSFPLTTGFWNAWYEGDQHGSNSNKVDFPLDALRFDFLFHQSAGQFLELASGPSTTPPEKLWIESVKIVLAPEAKK